ncbi:hypothetical protein [Oxynema aestuarii]|jgi:hypothetical protein|uniref:Uncharacterized protein n=1 Tax=Oxynema aestuarii AP17 TaxID=2064643 RepID=A0A6H1U3E8_9CYAN|nr:hypothetical protein [Oxynema aestuarii]QIZ73351.1 hypothetical protein HCG48_24375 [Oxynema aestuarii AP17]
MTDAPGLYSGWRSGYFFEKKYYRIGFGIAAGLTGETGLKGVHSPRSDRHHSSQKRLPLSPNLPSVISIFDELKGAFPYNLSWLYNLFRKSRQFFSLSFQK